MNNKQTHANIKSLINEWAEYLKTYNNDNISIQPADEAWSMGQVYKHLISATVNFHIPQIEICLNDQSNHKKWKNFKGFLAFKILKAFPPVQIKVPPSESYTPKQVESIDELKIEWANLTKTIDVIFEKLNQNSKQGKTTHPAFSYLNADEWFKLIEMHFKHHLRQKERIDLFLNSKK